MVSTLHASSCIFQSTLLMRGATAVYFASGKTLPFQSTLLMRGATSSRLTLRARSSNFNPRSSCEERPDSVFERDA